VKRTDGQTNSRTLVYHNMTCLKDGRIKSFKYQFYLNFNWFPLIDLMRFYISVYLLHCTWRCNILCSKHDIDMPMNEWNRHALFLCWNGRNRYSVLALVLIEDLGFLPLVREIQRLSTRSATLHSWKDRISHTRWRNPRSSIRTRVRTYYSFNRRYLRNQPIRNKNCLWRPCLLTIRDKMSNLYRGPSIDASYQVSVHLDKQFQRRRFF
jgi:hypothetical protein